MIRLPLSFEVGAETQRRLGEFPDLHQVQDGVQPRMHLPDNALRQGELAKALATDLEGRDAGLDHAYIVVRRVRVLRGGFEDVRQGRCGAFDPRAGRRLGGEVGL